MAIGTDIVARKYLNPVAGTPISVDIPTSDKTTVSVLLGESAVAAVQDTDYTVTLNTSTYADFTVTPTASMRTKIDALVALGETDQIVVRRTLNYLSDMTAELAFFRHKIATEFDKTIMRFQQIAEKIGRCIIRAENDTSATGSLVLPYSGNLAGKALVFDASENLTVSTDDYEDQAANAAASAAAALVSQNAAASSASAASTSAGNAHTSEVNAAASAAAAALNVVSAAMGPVCSAATLAAGRTALSVYSTAEVDTADNLKANIASPTGTGTATWPNIAATTTLKLNGTAVFNKINRVVISSSQTYTPTAGTVAALVECIGGGGGGNSCGATGATAESAGGGGGGGGYAASIITAPTSQTCTIGAGGAAATTGGTTSFGSLVVAAGGLGNISAVNATAVCLTDYAMGGAGTTGQILHNGGAGERGFIAGFSVGGNLGGGRGGDSVYGTGGQDLGAGGGFRNTSGYGGGGAGASSASSQAGHTGQAGGSGVVIVTEFISA